MNNSYDHIRSHQVDPHDRTWRSIKDKLARRKSQQRVAFYRNLSIAAGLIAILAIVVGFSGHLNVYNNNLYTSNEIFKPDFIEDLPLIKNDYFYAYDKILSIESIDLDSYTDGVRSLLSEQ